MSAAHALRALGWMITAALLPLGGFLLGELLSASLYQSWFHILRVQYVAIDIKSTCIVLVHLYELLKSTLLTPSGCGRGAGGVGTRAMP